MNSQLQGAEIMRDNGQSGAASTAPNPQSTSAEDMAARHGTAPRKSFVRKALNRILHLLCRFLPGATTVRPFLHRMRGMQIGKNVWIGEDAYLENEFPELVEIHDRAVVGLRATIIAHTRGAGRIVISKDVYIGAGCVIVTANRPLVIGEGSVIMASSLVTGNVAPYTLYGSDASKPLARITKPFAASESYEEFMSTLRPLSS
jgi:UDP-3-O-[3-hydroxymyristoyl] glucosamine N-acyltransferase